MVILFLGKYWCQSFRLRHPDLTLRVPERVSLARLLAFNAKNVGQFYKNLRLLMEKYTQFADGSRVFNLDETGVTTVASKSSKVLAERGSEVQTVSTAERGPLITVCAIINALGNQIPPAIIFPRVNFQPHMTNGAPPGTLGLATQSGWSNAELFLQVMKHFVKHTNSSEGKNN